MSSRPPGAALRLRHRVEYALLRLVAAGISLLPARLVVAVGRGLGLAAWAADPRHRSIAERNLARAFGESLSPRSRRRLVRNTFARFGEALTELLLFPRISRSGPERWAEVRGFENLRAALREGRGVLVTSGHFGNWELVALVQALLGVPMSLVARPLDNPWLDRWLEHLRTLSGNRVVPKGRALRDVVPALKRGEAVALVTDQNVRGKGGVFVQFFGRPASTSAALGLLAVKHGAPIVPVFSFPIGGGRHRIEYEEPIRPRADAADRRAEAERLTREAAARLEARVRQHPELWLWMHERWRTRPADAPAPEPGVEARSA
jgi:KDO2-lipid IV(A) lauroyltransferase